MEENNNIIELIDEDGNAVQFEHLCTVPYDGDEYIVLADVNDDEDDEEQAVVILRIVPKEDGDDEYDGEVEEDILNAVFEKFLEMTEEFEEDE